MTPTAIFLEQIDAQLAMDFLQHFEAERRSCTRTGNAGFYGIILIVRFLRCKYQHCLNKLCAFSRLIRKADTPLISYSTRDEMQVILNVPDLQCHTGIRERAILYRCFTVGLSASELVSLPLQSVDMRQATGDIRYVSLWTDHSMNTAHYPDSGIT
jgi:site-specific recombinase XerD